MSVLTKTRKSESELSTNGSDESRSLFRREIEDAFDRAFRMIRHRPWFDFDRAMAAEWPAMDVSENEKSLNIRCDVPGLRPQDIDVQVSDNVLSIRGQREETSESKDNGKRRERFAGSFSRTITLPSYVQTDSITAKCDNGVLNVTIPIKAGAGSKKVRVEST